ncbi:MAG: serine/threonine-protein kinase, partial [Pirellulaceae bacterium]
MSLGVGPVRSNRAIYLAALDVVDEQDRLAFLEQACAGDPERRRALERLLAAHGECAANPMDEAVKQLGPAETLGPEADPSLEFDVSSHPVIDRYKLLEQIGEGGMGAVFMAQQSEPIRRKVALKLIKAGMDSREVIARFQAERQALAMMDHPNIAHVLDAGTTAEGRPYFVMELVRGVPITEYCDSNRLSINDRLRLFIDVCRAVQHAHQKGIIHRDLKPTNVMVTLHDGTPVVKVIDFGVAKALDQELAERTLFTQFSQMVGTPLYMSPEQAEMSGLDIDTRSDVYSLGVLLYELLTGTTPFDKETFSKAGFDGMRRIIREEEPSRPSHKLSTLEAQLLSTVSSRRNLDPRQLAWSLRRELDWIAMKALEKDRNRRYESASALAADIQRYLDDEPVHACPPSVRYRMKKAAARHRGALIAALLVLTVLLGGTTASIWQAVRAGHARRLADERSRDAQAQQQIAERQTRLAQSERDRASRANQRAQTLLYTSDMKLASDAIINDDLPRATELLQRHVPERADPDLRGFEWHYFQQRAAGPDHIPLDQGDWVR